MAKIQCKMCGGELQLPEGMYSGSCPYCGTLTTFPKVSSEELENLYNRAEHFRRINEYDKAVSAYEKIVEINPDDAEAYWGLVISKFGIEYVEDPVSHERIPTCHRVHYESILADADYLNALEKAGSYEKDIYKAEAKRIAEIQRDILTISNNEQPFDIFICYKESDNFNKRTRDSVTAQEIYYQLTNAGYKVFFSRITLESKLGKQYEPYIFAALNSAKVMLVIGSQKEYFDAAWVRNEWSRFLALMKKDRSKLLIPCYKDMDAYDIPDALSMFQAQDMGKIGFIQDLLHGIKKVVVKDNSSTPAATATSGDKNHPLLRRAKLFLENNDFESAKEYCEKTLDQDPENAWAYYYRMRAELYISNLEELLLSDFIHTNSYRMARKFANTELNLLLDRIVKKQKKIFEQESVLSTNNQEYNTPQSHLIIQEKIREQLTVFTKLLFEENTAIYKRTDVIEVLQNCRTIICCNTLSSKSAVLSFRRSLFKEKNTLLSTRKKGEVANIIQAIDDCLKATGDNHTQNNFPKTATPVHHPQKMHRPVQTPPQNNQVQNFYQTQDPRSYAGVSPAQAKKQNDGCVETGVGCGVILFIIMVIVNSC